MDPPAPGAPTLLSIKLHPPPARSKRVSRPHLLARLSEDHPLILVSAPAGFGKSSLVSDWHYQLADTILGTQTAMTCSLTSYTIRIHGHLDDIWTEWFEGLTISCDTHGTTTLYGPLRDQAALYGLLIKVRDLGLTLISVNAVSEGDGA